MILYQATFAITEIDFGPGPFRCQIEQQHLDFAVLSIPLGKMKVKHTEMIAWMSVCLYGGYDFVTHSVNVFVR